MTTVAPTAPRSPVRHATTRLLWTSVVLAGWFWAIAITGLAVATVVVAAVAGTVDVSIVQHARHGGVWFPFSQAIIVVATCLRTYVAAGLTRRTFLRASLAAMVLTGLLYAVVAVVLLVVERGVHSALGWGTALMPGGLAADDAGAGVLLTEFGLTFATANVTGLLVGVAYQRGGGWWGTLSLPLTMAPLLGTLFLVGGWGGPVLLEGPFGAAAPTVAVLVATAALVAAAAAYAALVRTVEISTPAT